MMKQLYVGVYQSEQGMGVHPVVSDSKTEAFFLLESYARFIKAEVVELLHVDRTKGYQLEIVRKDQVREEEPLRLFFVTYMYQETMEVFRTFVVGKDEEDVLFHFHHGDVDTIDFSKEPMFHSLDISEVYEYVVVPKLDYSTAM